MRNLLEYPITLQEVIDLLERLETDAIKEGEEKLLCGDMRPLLLRKAIQVIERERFLHGD